MAALLRRTAAVYATTKKIMYDCPDTNRKAGTWGYGKLNIGLHSPSQYWYLSIRVFSEGHDPLFPGTLCEVGVGTEYALLDHQPVSDLARARYIKSTVSFSHAKIQQLAQANSAYNTLEANEQRAPLRVDLGFYWNNKHRSVHTLHLKQNGFTLLHTGRVSDSMDVWPVVSVTSFSQCNTKVEIRVLRPAECLFTPDMDCQDLRAIVDDA